MILQATVLTGVIDFEREPGAVESFNSGRVAVRRVQRTCIGHKGKFVESVPFITRHMFYVSN